MGCINYYFNIIYFILGWLFACFVVYSQQAAMSSPLLDEELEFAKRRIDAQARTSIPLFRGSNLRIFVRKRPSSIVSEQSAHRRRDIGTSVNNQDNILAELLYNTEHQQRRFDDYSENPGPMFGR